jgi:AMP-binding enzyme
MGSTEPWVDVRPSASLARRYRDLGLWRDVTPAADLRFWARETPDAVAITAHVAGAEIVRMTYRDYADQVERVATVLAGLGVGPGDVVALQLPNWWQVNAVVLACARLGAVVAPVVTTVRARELELMLSRLQPVACVTTEVWDGYKHSAALATIAARVPSLRHRLIVGGRTEPGEIDLTRASELVTPGEFIAGDAAEEPDRVSIVLFTSGTTGSPRAVLHSFDPGMMPGTGLTRQAPAPIRFADTHVLPRILPLLRLVMNPHVHTVEDSGGALARLLTDPALAGTTGRYFEGREEARSSSESYDESRAEELWRVSEALTAPAGGAEQAAAAGRRIADAPGKS